MAPGLMTTWSQDRGTFEEVVVDLSQEGWTLLTSTQKILYKDVTLEIFRNLASVRSLNLEPKRPLQTRMKFGENHLLSGKKRSTYSTWRGTPCIKSMWKSSLKQF
ncbi:unnamed protein product [Nyctereutes procyonoides]|uniref:(raccoon dog) hypothetical protein n=1 Tax=Nyctereutes procyonoides TaxID=34880 RepID=A0A811YMR9_NYCPR|nr:unnamed protein product [Nyctereutes procyonoides]